MAGDRVTPQFIFKLPQNYLLALPPLTNSKTSLIKNRIMASSEELELDIVLGNNL